MKKAIMFSCLLAGFTACTLDTLTQEVFLAGIEETSGGAGTSTTNIIIVTNPAATNTVTNIATNTITNDTVTALSTNTTEKLNLELLSTFSISTAGLIQYNTNHGAVATWSSASINFYFDNISNPTKAVRTTTYTGRENLSTYGNIYAQTVAQYTVTRLPDYTSSVVYDNPSVNLNISGGMFLKLTPTFGKTRALLSAGVLSDWFDVRDSVSIWVKFSGNTAQIISGEVNPANSSQFVFDNNPNTFSPYTKQ